MQENEMAKKVAYKEYQATIETRAAKEGEAGRVLFGLIPYLSRSENMGGFIEVIAPSAFAHTLADGADVKCLIDHDSAKIVARVKNDTLKLTSENDGLHFEVTLNDTRPLRKRADRDHHLDVVRVHHPY